MSPIAVVTQSNYVESYLQPYETRIGSDLQGYRNHIYRVLSYAQHILSVDNESCDSSERNHEILAAALVYHDIGLWSDGGLAYLDPSVTRAKSDLTDKFTSGEMEIITSIIYWHHKSTQFKSEEQEQQSNNKQLDAMVNAVRCADWIDFSLGLVSMGMPSSHIATVKKAIPNAGFHKTLLEFGPKLHGWDIIAIVKDLSTLFKL